jgi:sulfatase modifying factor 1
MTCPRCASSDRSAASPWCQCGGGPEGVEATGVRWRPRWPRLPPAISARAAGRRPGGAEAVAVALPPGTFTMGAAADDPEAFDDDLPARVVTLTHPFALWSVPLTQARYEVLMGHNPDAVPFVCPTCRHINTPPSTECADCMSAVGADDRGGFPGPSRPVTNVTWYEALRFCNALSRAHGLPEAYEIGEGEAPTVRWHGLTNPGWRLPTEAEWEYACRAGTAQERYGPIDEVAWYDGNAGESTRDVGLLKPNAWGFYDMLGNVQEWVWDPVDEPPAASPGGPRSSAVRSERVCRGGSWSDEDFEVRASRRVGHDPWTRSDAVGFRPARTRVDGED